MRWVERVGNLLPHPFTLFSLLALSVLLLSGLLSALSVSVTTLVAAPGEAPSMQTIEVVNLLSRESVGQLLSRFVDIYIRFPPLGLAMAMMLGIGVLEQSGLVSAVLRRTLLAAHPYVVTALLAFIGINANLASEAGVIFTITLGGALFAAQGRNPWVGIAVGYAAASGGFTANLLVAGTDALLSGITRSAAQAVGLVAPTHALINWYFTIAATFVITAVVTVVAERHLVPALGGEEGYERDPEAMKAHALTAPELRGLRFAGLVALFCLGLLAWGLIPKEGYLREMGGAILPRSPFTEGIVALLFFFFLSVGVGYGVGSGSVRTPRDVPHLMEGGLRGLMSFIVVALPASLFIHFFRVSKLALILATGGSALIKHFEIGGLPLLLALIIVTTVLNTFLPSGSAKWMIFAPVFVPMFAHAHISPAMTQMAFRVGDSATNVIAPFKTYLPVIIALLEQHNRDREREVGIGTVVSLELAFSGALLLSLTSLLIGWYLLGLPLGPGAGVHI